MNGNNENRQFYHDIVRLSTSLICASGYNPNVSKKFKQLWPSGKKMDLTKAKEKIEALRRKKLEENK